MNPISIFKNHQSASHNVIHLSPDEQYEFLDSLNAPIKLSTKQKTLGKKMKEFDLNFE